MAKKYEKMEKKKEKEVGRKESWKSSFMWIIIVHVLSFFCLKLRTRIFYADSRKRGEILLYSIHKKITRTVFCSIEYGKKGHGVKEEEE